ncbi:MAG: ABC transporter ATP-binding protein [Planctomycetota bacterium]|nr:ABC transporter ATP-binding protein [Planctomycetota bacterium]
MACSERSESNRLAVIEAENLSKVYRTPFSRYSIRALDNLNIKVFPGEIFGFLGPNGSGKTTTMKIFLGLISPTSGEARVLGRTPTDVAVKNRIGFLPEESYLYRFLSAEETLDFFARIFRIPRKERKVKIAEVIEMMGLTDARKRPVREYSKGMARRLGFAQALINDPDVIFLDEPTTGLDPLVSRQVKDIILDLKRKGKTIFMSSHLLSDVENICDRIAILHLGKLQEIGSVSTLIASKEILKISVKGLTQQIEPSVKEFIQNRGAEVLDIQPATETLETIFLRSIRKSGD